jgi:hypothetical protein
VTARYPQGRVGVVVRVGVMIRIKVRVKVGDGIEVGVRIGGGITCKGGATVLKVRGQYRERSERKIFFDPLFAVWGGQKHTINDYIVNYFSYPQVAYVVYIYHQFVR